MTSLIQKLQFRGLPEWFRQKGYDRLPKDGRFQPAEVTEGFVNDYLKLDPVGRRNVFVYADQEADEKLLLLLNQKGKKSSFNPRDILLANEKVIAQKELNLFMGGGERNPIAGLSVIPAVLTKNEKERLHLEARLIFTLGDPSLLKLLDQYGYFLFITAGDGPDEAIGLSVVAHERAHATLNLLNNPDEQELKKEAGLELKGAKEKLAALFAELKAKEGIEVSPEIYETDRQLTNLHPLVYLYDADIIGKSGRNIAGWLKEQQLLSAAKVYELLFEKTVLGDPEGTYGLEHRLAPKEEWVVEGVIGEWMKGRSPKEVEEIVKFLLAGDPLINDRVWRYLERQILRHETGVKVLSKEELESLHNIFRYIFYGRDEYPELARDAFSLLVSHPQFFPPWITRRVYFSPPRFFIHDYYDLVSKSKWLGRKIVLLNWENENLLPKKIQIIEGTPPYAPPKEKEWIWSPLRAGNLSETEEVLTTLWYRQWNRNNLKNMRRENRGDFWWGMGGTSAGLLFSLLGGATLWQEGEMKPMPLGITIGGAAMALFSGSRLWQSHQEEASLNQIDRALKGFFTELEPIPDLETAQKIDLSQHQPLQIHLSNF